jgi:hypothetical protein
VSKRVNEREKSVIVMAEELVLLANFGILSVGRDCKWAFVAAIDAATEISSAPFSTPSVPGRYDIGHSFWRERLQTSPQRLRLDMKPRSAVTMTGT